MARPTTITADGILKAARALFLEKGFGVSTADIARKAGVSEGSLFKRFPTKADLFRAAMGLPEFHLETETANLVGKGDLRANLARLMGMILEFHRILMPRVMMMWAQPGLNPMEMLRGDPDNSPPHQVLQALSGYLAGEMERGRLKPQDADVVASMIMSSMHSYVFLEQIGVRDQTEEAAGDYIQSVIDVLMEGIAP